MKSFLKIFCAALICGGSLLQARSVGDLMSGISVATGHDAIVAEIELYDQLEAQEFFSNGFFAQTAELLNLKSFQERKEFSALSTRYQVIRSSVYNNSSAKIYVKAGNYIPTLREGIIDSSTIAQLYPSVGLISAGVVALAGGFLVKQKFNTMNSLHGWAELFGACATAYAGYRVLKAFWNMAASVRLLRKPAYIRFQPNSNNTKQLAPFQIVPLDGYYGIEPGAFLEEMLIVDKTIFKVSDEVLRALKVEWTYEAPVVDEVAPLIEEDPILLQ